MNQVAPTGFTQAMQGMEDNQGSNAPLDIRLECQDVPLYDDAQVMDKLMGIINQLGDLKHLKIGENEKQEKNDEVEMKDTNAGNTFMVTNNINNAIQKMIQDINEKGYIIHPNGKFKMIWDPIMAL